MKRKRSAVLLALFFGGLGIHKLYLKRSTSFALYLIFCWTFIPLVLSWFDALSYLLMSREDWNARYNE